MFQCICPEVHAAAFMTALRALILLYWGSNKGKRGKQDAGEGSTAHGSACSYPCCMRCVPIILPLSNEASSNCESLGVSHQTTCVGNRPHPTTAAAGAKVGWASLGGSWVPAAKALPLDRNPRHCKLAQLSRSLIATSFERLAATLTRLEGYAASY